jgi:shikimate kinase
MRIRPESFWGPIGGGRYIPAVQEGTVWLVGMMGAGKSSVARALASELSLPFVDADEAIAADAGMTISEIFAREGETGFRARERAEVEALAGRPLIAALGGGAMAQAGLAELLRRTGRVVYLRARLETLLQRIAQETGRPLLEGLSEEGRRERLQELLERRQAAFERAHLILDTDGLDVPAVARAVAAALEALREPA